MTPKARARALAWLERPAGWIPTLLVALGILVAAAWLMADPLRSYRLTRDDFPYLAKSLNAESLAAHLFEPHNAHVVPLFRLLTFGLIRLAGDLEHIPTLLAAASIGVLVLVMLTGGHLIAEETGRRSVGLAAMIGLGVTTVMWPSATWYAAGQTLWAALAVLVMLLFLQSWRRAGGSWRLLLATLAALAAPLFWGGGLVAGPVGAAYLWADDRPRCRKAAVVPLALSLVSLTLMLGVAGRALLSSGRDAGPPPRGWLAPLVGLLHTGQAVGEVLVLNNLGLDGATTPMQGLAFCVGLACLWAWSRGNRFRPNPLEAAGLMLLTSAFLLTFTFRSGYGYDSLRDLGWYHAVPQVGAVLFASGWWAGLHEAPATPERTPSRRALVILILLVAASLTLQTPRATRLFVASVPPLTASERQQFPVLSLQRSRAIYLAAEQAERQRKALARLDRAEAIAKELGLGRGDIRRVFGRIVLPGWPEQVRHHDAVDFLDLPDADQGTDPARVRQGLRLLLTPEPEPRPPWLAPGEPWPPEETGRESAP